MVNEIQGLVYYCHFKIGEYSKIYHTTYICNRSVPGFIICIQINWIIKWKLNKM
jgi:hypothetical protein